MTDVLNCPPVNTPLTTKPTKNTNQNNDFLIFVAFVWFVVKEKRSVLDSRQQGRMNLYARPVM
jgi:hypothetical protein